ncbi:NUDIX domain-containing protein [Streptomyces sodiiphilus]|uniref:NUDIX domain-containing protein n=1 Tax=Streptomyces sodiiphilus TaxID=226217 RepID=A0ABP5B9M0_9ACTN
MPISAHDDAPPAADSHCSFCGFRFPPGAGWPRTCERCGRTSYRNPLPVAVALLPVGTGNGPAALTVVRRTIQPGRGLLALPGGFIDHGETWQEAVVRELAEETGITAQAADVRQADVLSSRGGHLLVFGLLPERPAGELPAPRPTDETEGWELLRAPRELAFPLHTDAARRWFEGRYR